MNLRVADGGRAVTEGAQVEIGGNDRYVADVPPPLQGIARLRAMKPVVAVGIAFAAQEIDAVPITPRDARLDLVLTEREVIDFR